MLLRGGRLAALAAFWAEEGFEVTEALVLGVVADSAPGEGESMSAAMAEGDSEDIMLGDSLSQLLSNDVANRCEMRVVVSWTIVTNGRALWGALVVGRRGVVAVKNHRPAYVDD